MRLVLDNVGQGFVTLDAAGTMSDERSRVIDEWFGAADPGTKLWTIRPRRRLRGAVVRIGWAAIGDDVLPLSLCLDQLPKLVQKDGRAYELVYRPILEDERLAKLIVVITDVTARIERERAEQAQWEMMSVFRRVLSDRAALDDFFAQTTKLVRIITSAPGDDDADLRRQIHTIKGNTALFGIQSVATFCHQLEEKLAEAPSGVDPLSQADRDALGVLWSARSPCTPSSRRGACRAASSSKAGSTKRSSVSCAGAPRTKPCWRWRSPGASNRCRGGWP